jgi:hypothetical protein
LRGVKRNSRNIIKIKDFRVEAFQKTVQAFPPLLLRNKEF